MLKRAALVTVACLCVTCHRKVAPPDTELVPKDVSAEVAAVDAPAASPPVVEKVWDGEALLPEELRDTAPFGNDIKRATCGKRTDCSVMREKAAGKDALGNALSVVILRLGDLDGMSTREYWTIVRRDRVIIARARIATEYVTASYSAETTLTVKPNALTTWHDWWPTSNWQSYPWRTYQLWPPRMIAFSDRPHHRGGAAATGDDKLDFKEGTGDGSYVCDSRSASFLPIPASTLDSGLDPAKGLGTCAVRVDGKKGHGFMLAGVADRRSGELLVAKLGALYVEVHDDRWTKDDAIEIHVGRPAGFMQCFDPLVPSVMHVVTMDARVATPGDAEALKVERIRDEGGVRVFRIDNLPSSGITVVQRDDDGDGSPPRRIGTSPLDLSPELGDVSYTRAACAKTQEGPALVPFFE